MTERPHILPPPPGGGALRRPEERGAAFFDLDRTLIAGSSAFQFGRAAYRAGLVSRRQLAADAWENVRFRLRGSTDAATDALRERSASCWRGVRVRDLQRLAADVLAGVLPRLYPRMLEIAYEHQDAGRPIFICTAASQEMAELMAIVLTFDGAVGSVSEVVDGHYTGRAGGPVHVPRGQGGGDPRASPRARHRPRRVVGLLRLGVRPADAAARRPPGRGQPGRGARPRRARRGLGGPALRAPRPRPAGRGRGRLAAALGGLGSVVLSRRSAPPRRRANVALRRR